MKRPPKYRNKRVTIDGVTAPNARGVWADKETWQPLTRADVDARKKRGCAYFASGEEFRRWRELVLLERAGVIANLERQKTIKIEVNGDHVFSIKPDFLFFDGQQRVWEDRKGRRKGFEYRQFKDRWRVARAIHRNVEFRVNGRVWDGN